jgi:hypothetical protein
VTVDDVEIYNQIFSENDGLKRIMVPYESGTIGNISVTFVEETLASGCGIHINSVVWWKYNRSLPDWSAKVFDKNAVTVVIGDSWIDRYEVDNSGDGIVPQELRTIVAELGGTGTITGKGFSGSTTTHGLVNFDTDVAPHNPDQVVICWFTNDQNLWKPDYQRWVNGIYKLIKRCQEIGARPIVVRPLPTNSLAQSIEHGNWSNLLAPGLID